MIYKDGNITHYFRENMQLGESRHRLAKAPVWYVEQEEARKGKKATKLENLDDRASTYRSAAELHRLLQMQQMYSDILKGEAEYSSLGLSKKASWYAYVTIFFATGLIAGVQFASIWFA